MKPGWDFEAGSGTSYIYSFSSSELSPSEENACKSISEEVQDTAGSMIILQQSVFIGHQSTSIGFANELHDLTLFLCGSPIIIRTVQSALIGLAHRIQIVF